MKRVPFVLLVLSALGCSSFVEKQTNRFIDDDGKILTVVYGADKKKDHVSTFKTVKGTDAEFRSRLGVRVIFPSGREVNAWQCMNMLPSGTMYESEDGQWMYHAEGLKCSLFQRLPDGSDYAEVFLGSLCAPRPGER